MFLCQLLITAELMYGQKGSAAGRNLLDLCSQINEMQHEALWMIQTHGTHNFSFTSGYIPGTFSSHFTSNVSDFLDRNTLNPHPK